MVQLPTVFLYTVTTVYYYLNTTTRLYSNNHDGDDDEFDVFLGRFDNFITVQWVYHIMSHYVTRLYYRSSIKLYFKIIWLITRNFK